MVSFKKRRRDCFYTEPGSNPAAKRMGVCNGGCKQMNSLMIRGKIFSTKNRQSLLPVLFYVESSFYHLFLLPKESRLECSTRIWFCTFLTPDIDSAISSARRLSSLLSTVPVSITSEPSTLMSMLEASIMG